MTSRTNLLRGDEAYSYLQPYLSQLTFTQDSTDEEVISEVAEVFELDRNYKELELDVTFADGTKKSYRD